MTRVRALHTIQDASEHVVPTSAIDADGRILYRRERLLCLPGTVFEIDDAAKLRRLLVARAIEVLDDGYEDLTAEAAETTRAERGSAKYAPEAEMWPRPLYPNQTWSDEG